MTTPQGNHLHQRQGGGGLRQADTFRDEQPRERAEPHGHRIIHPFSARRPFAAAPLRSSWHAPAAPRYCVRGHHSYRYATPNGVKGSDKESQNVKRKT